MTFLAVFTWLTGFIVGVIFCVVIDINKYTKKNNNKNKKYEKN